MGDIYKTSGCEQTTPNGDAVLTLGCFPVLIQQLINIGFAMGGTIALIFIIISGFKLVRSGGDPKEAEGARKTLTFAITGLVIVLLSAAIVNLVGNLTGATCITIMGSCKTP